MEKRKDKRPLERLRLRWEDNIKMDIKEMGWGVEWIDLAQIEISGGIL